MLEGVVGTVWSKWKPCAASLVRDPPHKTGVSGTLVVLIMAVTLERSFYCTVDTCYLLEDTQPTSEPTPGSKTLRLNRICLELNPLSLTYLHFRPRSRILYPFLPRLFCPRNQRLHHLRPIGIMGRGSCGLLEGSGSFAVSPGVLQGSPDGDSDCDCYFF